MGFRCGIVGLPNVGKSTLFNALTQTASAQAENYPFCTIDPNLGRVAVPDGRLDRLAAIARSAKVIPTQLTFVDIAGLVRGASRGEGLGNKFLHNIREVDAIVHVLRCFVDDDVSHVYGRIDPVADAETVETELMLADLESLERRLEPLVKRARGRDREAESEIAVVKRCIEALSAGQPARSVACAANERIILRNLQLLTAKPVLYVSNVDEQSAASGNEASDRVAELAKGAGAGHLIVSAAIEADIAQITDADERAVYLAELGLRDSGLDRIITAGYHLLGLITFFTTNAKEAHAWTVPDGTLAPTAAGVIHSDFERGFIRVEAISYDDFVRYNGETGAKEAGVMRLEGRDYKVRDGDVLFFRFNA